MDQHINSPPKLGGEAERQAAAWREAGWFLKISPYFLQHPLNIFKHLLILKPDDPDVKPLQELGPSPIPLRPGLRHVPLPIQLDSQPAVRTKEVDNVRTNAMLSAKLLAVELRTLEIQPEQSLGGC